MHFCILQVQPEEKNSANTEKNNSLAGLLATALDNRFKVTHSDSSNSDFSEGEVDDDSWDS